jgi:hypothetical protein
MSRLPADDRREQSELLGRLCNENLDDDGMRRLSELLSDDIDAQRQYVRYLDLQVALRMNAQSLDDEDFTRREAQAALDALPLIAQSESANPVRGFDPTTHFDRLQKYARPLLWGTAAAAGLLIAAFVVSLRPAEVATATSELVENAGVSVSESTEILPSANLRGTVGARWAGKRLEFPEGEGFEAGQRLELVEGLAEIVFSSGARIVVQGPSIVEICDDHAAMISVGRVAGVVPESAANFRLRTAVADLEVSQAEFGAEIDVDGSLTTRVYGGKLEIEFNQGAAPKPSLQLASGQGARLDAATGQAALISEPSNLHFVRYLPHRETLINLSEIVAGGDDYGKAYHRGISLTDGEAVDEYGAPAAGTGKYLTTRDVEFVDGVFIPDGKRGPVQVDSIGRSFAGFPATAGDCWGGAIMARRPLKEDSLPLIRLEFHGNNYGYVNWLHVASKSTELSPRGYGLIGMHSNCGITFDLHAIRARYPDKKIMRFSAQVGNLESRTETESDQHTADAWVLVDGQRRHHRRSFNRESGAETIDVPLADHDRFLVLAVTDDGGDTAYDWVAFGDAVIEMSNLEVITSDRQLQQPDGDASDTNASVSAPRRPDISSIESTLESAGRLASIGMMHSRIGGNRNQVR